MGNESLQKFGVIGYPLTHSLSPHIHNFVFKKLHIHAVYEKIEIDPNQFAGSIEHIKNAGYSGLNITIPYKLKIMSFLDEIDNDAKIIGAVNTIKKKEKIWIGYNTDVHGFLSPIIDFKERIVHCLVLGTGGASRAVIYTLAKYLEPKSITIAGRNPQKTVNLKAEFRAIFNLIQIKDHSFTELGSILPEFNLIVNTTPLGTFPDVNRTPIPQLTFLPEHTIVYDLVYNPVESKFLKDVAVAGKNIIRINGMEMLIQQAAAAFTLWTGLKMPVNDVREYLLKV